MALDYQLPEQGQVSPLVEPSLVLDRKPHSALSILVVAVSGPELIIIESQASYSVRSSSKGQLAHLNDL